jgi:hypothetical protein
VIANALSFYGSTRADGKTEQDDEAAMGDEQGPRTHVVRQGEYLEQLAFNLGFDAKLVWDHEKNADLKKLRKDQHNILFPGDVLYIPALDAPPPAPVQGGTENAYSADIPKRTIQLQLHDDCGPLPNEPHRIEGLGDPIEGTCDDQGKLSFDVPLTTREVLLVLPNRGAFSLCVGDLDPSAEITGIQMRLAALGFYWGTPTGELDDDTRDAILRFQRDNGLEMTGELNADTVAKIESSYGC